MEQPPTYTEYSLRFEIWWAKNWNFPDDVPSTISPKRSVKQLMALICLICIHLQKTYSGVFVFLYLKYESQLNFSKKHRNRVQTFSWLSNYFLNTLFFWQEMVWRTKWLTPITPKCRLSILTLLSDIFWVLSMCVASL